MDMRKWSILAHGQFSLFPIALASGIPQGLGPTRLAPQSNVGMSNSTLYAMHSALLLPVHPSCQ